MEELPHVPVEVRGPSEEGRVEDDGELEEFVFDVPEGTSVHRQLVRR